MIWKSTRRRKMRVFRAGKRARCAWKSPRTGRPCASFRVRTSITERASIDGSTSPTVAQPAGNQSDRTNTPQSSRRGIKSVPISTLGVPTSVWFPASTRRSPPRKPTRLRRRRQSAPVSVSHRRVNPNTTVHFTFSLPVLFCCKRAIFPPLVSAHAPVIKVQIRRTAREANS